MLANEKKLKNVLGAAGICAAAACVIASTNQTTVLAAETYAETAEAGESAEVTLDSLLEGSGAAVLLTDNSENDNKDVALYAGAHFDEVSSEIRAAEEARKNAEAEVKAAEEARAAERAAAEAEAAAKEEAKAAEAEATEEAAQAEEETTEAAEEVASEATEEAATEETAVEEAAPVVEAVQAEAAAVETAATAAVSSAVADSDFLALCKIVQAEAGSEPVQGKIAVANVVLNRIKNPSFPSTVEDVIRQPGQFGPVRNGSYALAVPSTETIDAVKAALGGVDCSGGALYFKRSSSSTWGSRSLISRIGNHGFYA